MDVSAKRAIRRWLKKLAGPAIGALVAIAVNGLWQLRSEIERSLWNAYVSGHPLWLWVIAFWLGVLFMAAGMTAVWNPGLLHQMRRIQTDNNFGFTARVAITVVLGLMPLLVAWLLAPASLPNGDARVLFPQERELRPLSFANYATNGKASYDVYRKSDGIAEAYAEIRFQVYRPGIDANCGWVVYLAKGFDLSAYRSLRFLIRGQRGNERLIVKAKDANGHEEALELNREHLLDGSGKITAVWQEAVVPFDHFGNVDFSRMENVSLAWNGSLSGLAPQTIRVARIRFAE